MTLSKALDSSESTIRQYMAFFVKGVIFSAIYFSYGTHTYTSSTVSYSFRAKKNRCYLKVSAIFLKTSGYLTVSFRSNWVVVSTGRRCTKINLITIGYVAYLSNKRSQQRNMTSLRALTSSEISSGNFTNT